MIVLYVGYPLPCPARGTSALCLSDCPQRPQHVLAHTWTMHQPSHWALPLDERLFHLKLTHSGWQCTSASQVLSGEHAANLSSGVLRERLRLVAIDSASGAEIFSVSRVPVCSILTGSMYHSHHTTQPARSEKYSDPRSRGPGRLPGLERRGGPYLAACTMVTELDPLIDTAELTWLWVDYMLKNGVSHILLYG